MARHEEQIKTILAPYKLDGDFDAQAKTQGAALDRAEVDIDYIEENLLPDRLTSIEVIERWEQFLGLTPPKDYYLKVDGNSWINLLNSFDVPNDTDYVIKATISVSDIEVYRYNTLMRGSTALAIGIEQDASSELSNLNFYNFLNNKNSSEENLNSKKEVSFVVDSLRNLSFYIENNLSGQHSLVTSSEILFDNILKGQNSSVSFVGNIWNISGSISGVDQFNFVVNNGYVYDSVSDSNISISGTGYEFKYQNATIEARIQQIIGKITATGGLSKSYFESIALAMGYDVEFQSPPKLFRAGISRCNDRIYDPLDGFRALAGDVTGGLICSSDRSDLAVHLAHNDLKKNLRVYSEDATPRQWVFKCSFLNNTREEAEVLIMILLELKPIMTFVKWDFPILLETTDGFAFGLANGSGVIGLR